MQRNSYVGGPGTFKEHDSGKQIPGKRAQVDIVWGQ